MKQYISIISYFGLFLFFMAGDIVLYYTYGRHHSIVPFVMVGLVTLGVAVITGMALYQTHKHRDDEEPW